MHQEILTASQKKLLPHLKVFAKDFGLVGGTAIALQIGHRQSIDFDLFSSEEFDNSKLRQAVSSIGKINQVIKDEKNHYELVVDGVRLTFLHYPFKISYTEKIDNVEMPKLLTLAAMKAYALGRRAKWKDYVDLYFIMKDFCGIEEIAKEANKIFGKEFNEKNLRIQLAYFKDIDRSEKVIFMPRHKISDQEIQKALVGWSVS